MSQVRRRRGEPAPDTPSVVGSARDLDVLESLAWAGFLSTNQVERLHFPSRRTTQRRLRALLDHGLVRAHLQGEALQKESVFTLSPQAAEQLVERRGLEPATIKLTRAPRLGKLAHLLLVRDVFVDFVRAEQTGVLELRDFRFEEDVGQEPTLRAAGLVPDALADVAWGEATERLAVEADCGTETTTTLKKKLAAYRALFATAGSVLDDARSALLVVVLTDGRAASLRRLVDEAGLADRALVTLREHVHELLHARYAHAPYVRPVRAERTAASPQAPVFRPVAAAGPAAFRPLGAVRPGVRPAGARS